MVTHNLPRYPTPFVGRLTEIAEVAQRLDGADCHLLTLVGPGGIGKTRLAIEVAARCADQFAEGACFVALQPLNSPDFMVSAVADAVGLQFHPGDPKQQLLDYLRDKVLLLLLDNFEHLADGAGLLSDILNTAPQVIILATSRERLNLVEEWVFDVQELNYPVNEAEINIESYDAVQLFMQHARRVRTEFVLTSHQKPAVIRICRLVGGMPLGIELAATWMRTLPSDAIVRELERSLDILETPMHNREPRHRNIRAAFEPTWNRLSEQGQAVFRKLSIFRGGFTRDAAEQVAEAVLPTLSALVDKSLVRLNDHGRYDLHELLRQYAEERLRDTAGELEAVSALHSRYFAAFLEQREKTLEGRGQKEALEEIQQEIDNIRAAWGWAIEHKQEAEIEKACHALWNFYDTRSWFQEAEKAFRRAAEALGMNGLDEDKSVVLGKIMASYGGFCFSLNMTAKARKLLEESLSIFRRHHALSETGFVLLRLSEVAMFLEDDSLTARSYLQESLTIFQALGNQWGIAYSLRWLGFTALYRGDYKEALRLSQESLVICEETDDSLGKANALTVVFFAALESGDYERARQVSLEIGALTKALGLHSLLSIAPIMHGAALCGLGDNAGAKHSLYEGLRGVCEVLFAPYILLGVLETASWLIATGSKTEALQILAFLLQHPVPPNKGKSPVNRMIAKLQNELPADIFEAALEQGKSLNMDAAVQICLDALHPAAETPQLLTERELEILRLVAQGFSNRAIAKQLIFSVGTVKWYMHQIYSKLDVGSRTQAIARAREMKLLL